MSKKLTDGQKIKVKCSGIKSLIEVMKVVPDLARDGFAILERFSAGEDPMVRSCAARSWSYIVKVAQDLLIKFLQYLRA